MLVVENIILAFNSIMSNKMRAFLTMLGIIIGIGAVISILTVGNSLTLTVEDNMQSMGSKDIFVTVVERSDDGPESAIDGVKYPESNASRRDMKDSDYITSDMIHDMSEKFSDRIYAVNVSDQVGNGEVFYQSDVYHSRSSARRAVLGHFAYEARAHAEQGRKLAVRVEVAGHQRCPQRIRARCSSMTPSMYALALWRFLAASFLIASFVSGHVQNPI